MTALPGKPAANSTPETDIGTGSLLAASPGQRLKKAREVARLDIKQAAESLHLSPGVVKALEADDYRALPNATFVKGYLRSYARLLSVPGEELVRTYESITGQNQPKPVVPIELPRTKPKFALPLQLLLVVALVVGGLSYWYSTRTAEPQQAAEPTVDTAAVVAAEEAAGGVEQPAVMDAGASDTTVEMPAAEQSVSAATPESAETPDTVTESSAATAAAPEPEAVSVQPAASAEPSSSESAIAEPVAPATSADSAVSDTAITVPSGSAEQGTLSMAFSGDCWVEVRDATGELIYSNLKRNGDTLTLKGTPPLEAKLGNGNYVSLTYNGNPVSFHTPSHNVVRVRLGE